LYLWYIHYLGVICYACYKHKHGWGQQEVVVVNRHIEKWDEEHGNGCFKHKSTSITYSGCSDLVFGYDSWDLDKWISLLERLLMETKWSMLDWIMQEGSHDDIVREVAGLWWCLATLAVKLISSCGHMRMRMHMHAAMLMRMHAIYLCTAHVTIWSIHHESL